MDLLDCTARPTIRGIRAGKCERAPAVVAAASVELRGMVGECERVSSKKSLELEPRGVKLRFGLLEPSLRDHDAGQTPPHLRIAARKRRPK
jgi:hypothetical protein